MRRFLLFFVLIVMAGIGAAGFWYWQDNQYSKEILKLEILGPATVQAGEQVEYLVKFKNNGKVRLEEPELTFEYPKNSVPQENQPLRIIRTIEDIYPGEERMISFKGQVFGKEQEVLEANVWLTYRPKNLKAKYESKTSFTSQIKYIPLTLEFDLPSKIEQGEEIEFSLNYFSNLNYVVENLRAKIEYPNGFEFVSSQPQSLDETEWVLPSLGKVDGGRITIRGRVEGEEAEKKIFRAQLGMVRDGEFILLKDALQTVEIIAPTFYVSQLINGSQNYLVRAGDLLHYEIFFKNIGKKPIQKKFLFVKLEGDIFDLQSLKSERGEIGRGDNSIIWDWKQVPELRFLDADDEGKVEFWVKVKEGAYQKSNRNPVLRSKITLGGTEKVFETKINSEMELSQKVYFEEEFFGNSGPLPPQTGTTTTYTVVWQLKNSWNDLKNVKVKTMLPEYVRPTGKIFPEDAKFTFDSQSREVIWNIGDVSAFQGLSESTTTPLTLAFQIEFTPNEDQKGSVPFLVRDADAVGEDDFTKDVVQAKAKGVDATLPDDKTVSEQQGIVQ